MLAYRIKFELLPFDRTYPLGSLSKIVTLILIHNALSDAISELHFCNLNNLKYLDLSNKKLAFNITLMSTFPFHFDVD